MYLPVALTLIILGGLTLTRARAFLHWKRGHRQLSSWQRTWMLRGEDIRTIRIYGAAMLGLGLLTLIAAIQLGEPQGVASLSATLRGGADWVSIPAHDA